MQTNNKHKSDWYKINWSHHQRYY